ncbi:MAG TPA: matrixin family metalloprotease [Candidatus Saccharimonadales bacterium]|nr:matrixin family metalloprotease [Candidatus Saccharimonadales bacterium]
MSLKTLARSSVTRRYKQKGAPKGWLVTFGLSLVATIMLLLGSIQPALADTARCRPDGGPYDCKLMDFKNGWRNVTSLTYCFPTSERTIETSYGKMQGYPLPADYQKNVNSGAHIWSTTPGLQVKLAVSGCTSKTDIRIYAVHMGSGQRGIVGLGGCSVDSSKYCQPGSGQIEVNIDQPNNDAHAQFWLNEAVHEFGHVLGLAHPCDNKCVGPVMSYATCPSADNCPADPNYDDIAGIQQVYRWPATSNGGGGCNLVSATDTSTTTHTYLTDPVIGTTPLPTIPDPGSFVPSLYDPITSGLLPTIGTTYPVTVPDTSGLTSMVEGLVDDGGPNSLVTVDTPTVMPPAGGSVIDGALSIVARLADPRIDAYETLAANGGTIRNEMDWVFLTTGVPVSSSDLPQTCL